MLIVLSVLLLSGCQPAAEANVLGYLLARQLDSLTTPASSAAGAIEGRVREADGPIPGATVLVAERSGRAHTARTDAEGRYRIDGVPADGYTVASVAAGYGEAQLHNVWGGPVPVTVRRGETVTAPDLQLSPLVAHDPAAFDLASLQLRQTASYTAAAPFPEGAAAQVRAFAFERDGVLVDSLRLYLPLDAGPEERFPLVLFVAPTAVDDWQQVSVAFASQGYALVALSPVAERGVDADAQAQDAAAALALAQAGALGPEVGDNRPVVMGGSYSSAILARLVRTAGDELGGWVSVGGLSNAFDGAAAYYAGQLEMPANFELLVPAFGLPNVYPMTFLRYSPVYVASELPPTLLVHTTADRVLPIDQAYQLEAAARAAGVPVDTYYYTDTSHYLGIGDNLTDAGRQMFYKIVDFIERYGIE